jgi:SAM-dependent methyltransferase
MNETRDFYDRLADSYHLIFEDWDGSVARQGESLSSILSPLVPPNALILDVAAGIGTQALGLIQRGYRVFGSDISMAALARARREFAMRQLSTALCVADFRALPFLTGAAHVAMACDNALPHLLSLDEMETALRELARCVCPGGIVLITMRDYSVQPAGTREVKPYGERTWNGRRYFAEQEWLWQGSTYRLTLRIRPLAAEGDVVEVQSTYFAVPIAAVLAIMNGIGLAHVRRVDGVFYQPVLLGTVPPDDG